MISGLTPRVLFAALTFNWPYAATARTFALLGLLFITPPAVAEQVVVGVNQSGQITTELSRGTLQAIFGMRLRTWPDGSAIKVFVLPDNHPTHVAFCKQMLHVFPHEMRSAWDRLVFSGTGQAPIEVGTEEIMRAKLATTAGAIGYLTKTSNDGSISVIPIK